MCELDHAGPWHPVRPEDVPGRTDIDQLAPLCRRDNAGKERDGWSATQKAHGTRRWHHQRSGFTIRTLPATWRPPPRQHRTTLRGRPTPRDRPDGEQTFARAGVGSLEQGVPAGRWGVHRVAARRPAAGQLDPVDAVEHGARLGIVGAHPLRAA